MKTYLKDYKLTIDLVEQAIYDCLTHKWKRKDVSYFLAEYEMTEGENLHVVAKRCRELAINKDTRPLLATAIRKAATRMYHEIKDRNIQLKPIEYQMRFDSSSNKLREIGISSIKQQVYDYVAVNACKKMFSAKIGYYQCASIPKKGQVFGKKAIEKWIKKDPKNTRFHYKCDIKKYYLSVNTRKLKRLLRRDIKNKDILYLIFRLLSTYKRGLCIGSYLSQYLANYYLSYAYHHVTENSFSICTKKNGEKVRINHVKHILFYMDDLILFSSSLKFLKRAIEDLLKYLSEELVLTVKENHLIGKTKDTRIDMMGYSISVKNTIVRKKIYKKIFNLILCLNRKVISITIHIARRLLSYNGWIKNSDLYNFANRFHVTELIEKAKQEVSHYDKNKFYRETKRLQLLPSF